MIIKLLLQECIRKRFGIVLANEEINFLRNLKSRAVRGNGLVPVQMLHEHLKGRLTFPVSYGLRLLIKHAEPLQNIQLHLA
ncbi:hypothetical protein D1872_318860 [compost metagenome]